MEDLVRVLEKEMIDTIEDFSDKHCKTAVVRGQGAIQVFQWVRVAARALFSRLEVRFSFSWFASMAA